MSGWRRQSRIANAKESQMNPSIRVRVVSLFASVAATFALVYAMAAIGYPEPVEPQLAQATATTCVR